MNCLPVKRADIRGNCILGANLAALTTWPFNPSIRCVCWEHVSPQSSLQPRKKWAPAFSESTRHGRTIFTRKADCQASAHVQTTDHNSREHESRLLIVCPERTNRRQTWCAEEQTTLRTVHQHNTWTQRASIFFFPSPKNTHGWQPGRAMDLQNVLARKDETPPNGLLLQASSKQTRCPKLNL